MDLASTLLPIRWSCAGFLDARKNAIEDGFVSLFHEVQAQSFNEFELELDFTPALLDQDQFVLLALSYQSATSPFPGASTVLLAMRGFCERISRALPKNDLQRKSHVTSTARHSTARHFQRASSPRCQTPQHSLFGLERLDLRQRRH